MRVSAGGGSTVVSEPVGQHDTSTELWTLDNGLRVVVQADRTTPLVAVCAAYDSGSGRDPDNRSGLAHLCEHLSYCGKINQERENLAEVIENRGGVAQGKTSHDQTLFTNLVPSELLEPAIWVESLRLAEPGAGLSASTLNREQKVIQQEQITMLDGPAYGRAFEKLQRLLYPADHPYHRLPIGTFDGVQSVTLTDVEQVFSRHYHPRHTVLAVVGDLDRSATRGWIEERFGPISKSSNGGAPAAEPTAVPVAAERYATVTDSVPVPRTYVGYRIPTPEPRAGLIPGLLANGMTLGRNRPLHHRLTSASGPAKELQATVISTRHEATLVFYAGAKPGIDEADLRQDLIEAVQEELSRPLSRDALERAVQRSETHFTAEMQWLDKRAERLALRVLEGQDAKAPDPRSTLCSEIGVDELHEASRGLCAGEPHAVLSILPVSSGSPSIPSSS